MTNILPHRIYGFDSIGQCLVFPSSPRRRRMLSFAKRFDLQSVLELRKSQHHGIYTEVLSQRWEAAVAILRSSDILDKLDSDQVRFFSTLSNNSVFNDIPTAILAEAISTLWSPLTVSFFLPYKIPPELPRGNSNPAGLVFITECSSYPVEFWVALSACVFGDLPLLHAYLDKSGPSVKQVSVIGALGPSKSRRALTLLLVAIKHIRIDAVRYLLEEHPSILSDKAVNTVCLAAAVFAQDNGILNILLECTPHRAGMLSEALILPNAGPTQSGNNSEAVKMFVRHFSPLKPRMRKWLVMYSCAIGDVTLLEEISKTTPLYPVSPGIGIQDNDWWYNKYIMSTIRHGNAASLRFLLHHHNPDYGEGQWLQWTMEEALSCNKIECYRELCLLFKRDSLSHPPVDSVPESPRWFEYLGWADNAEESMVQLISEHDNLIFDTLASKPSMAQRALWNAIQRLRPGNVQFLLDQNVKLVTWRSKDPFDIKWPYFNQHREAFARTQALLDQFGLPKLRIIV